MAKEVSNPSDHPDKEDKPRIMKIFIKTLHNELIDFFLVRTLDKDEGTYEFSGNPYYRVIINMTDETDNIPLANKAWTFETPEQRDFFYDHLMSRVESLPTVLIL